MPANLATPAAGGLRPWQSVPSAPCQKRDWACHATPQRRCAAAPDHPPVECLLLTCLAGMAGRSGSPGAAGNRDQGNLLVPALEQQELQQAWINTCLDVQCLLLPVTDMPVASSFARRRRSRPSICKHAALPMRPALEHPLAVHDSMSTASSLASHLWQCKLLRHQASGNTACNAWHWQRPGAASCSTCGSRRARTMAVHVSSGLGHSLGRQLISCGHDVSALQQQRLLALTIPSSPLEQQASPSLHTSHPCTWDSMCPMPRGAPAVLTSAIHPCQKVYLSSAVNWRSLQGRLSGSRA